MLSLLLSLVLIILVLVSLIDGNDLSSQFTIEGRIHQIEYATKATMKGSSIIAAHNKNISILISYKGDIKSNILSLSSSSLSSIRMISNTIGYSAIGISSDINYLSNKLHDNVLNHITIFDSLPPVIRITNNLASYIHSRTITSKYRPFGIRLCIIGYDIIKGAIVIDIDALGNIHHNKLCCLGPRANSINSLWDRKIDPLSLSSSELIEKLINTLKECLKKDNITLNTNDISIALVGQSKRFTILNNSEIEEILNNNNFSLIC